MPGDYLKLVGFDGPTTISSTAIAPSEGPLPAAVLTNAFAGLQYYLSVVRPSADGVFSSGTGAGAGTAQPQPMGLNLPGGVAIPSLVGAFFAGQAISKAYVYSTTGGGPGGKEWVTRFWILGSCRLSQVQSYSDTPQGTYSMQLDYGAALLGHVPTPGGPPVTSGWNFIKSIPWDGVTAT